MSAGKLFDEVLQNLLNDSAIKTSTMFGMRCAKIAGKAFVGLHTGRLIAKIGPVRAQQFLNTKKGEPFDPGNLGNPMREWIMLAPPAIDLFPEEVVAYWISIAEEAKSYVKTVSGGNKAGRKSTPPPPSSSSTSAPLST
ncbi:MAG: hypothetical protein KIH69_017010 [Anaerolineae bacterium]|nr:hypothetical protein [Anaerolineae bacterium]